MSESLIDAFWRCGSSEQFERALAHRPRVTAAEKVRANPISRRAEANPRSTHPPSDSFSTNAMAKKRKASGQPKPSKSDAQSSKLAVNTYEDVADSEDEFHINRDKILLDEGPEAKRRRKWQEEGMRSRICKVCLNT